MTARRRQVATLARLQRAERDAAAGDAALAGATADAARAEAERRDVQTLALAARWFDAINGGVFEPDAGARLGGAVIAAEASAVAGRCEAEAAAARHDLAIDRWQLADARVAAGARVAKSLARHADRAAEEAALAATEDRLATRWAHR